MSGRRAGARGRLAAAASVVVLVGLVGCVPIARVSAKLVDGGIAFAVCEGTVVNEVAVSVRPLGSAEEPVELWHASGAGELSPGAIIVSGVPPEATR